MKKTPFNYEMIHLMTAHYLGLYNNSKLHKTIFDVLNYIFIANGNGYKWVNGIPTDSDMEIDEDLVVILDSIFERYKSASESDIDYLFRINDFSSSLEEMTKDSVNMYIFNISKDSLMYNLPKEIEKSWYEALQKLHSILLDNEHKLTSSNLKYLKKSIKDLKKVTVI